jgi:uncharacterized protein YybS (DUF2232 family)
MGNKIMAKKTKTPKIMLSLWFIPLIILGLSFLIGGFLTKFCKGSLYECAIYAGLPILGFSVAIGAGTGIYTYKKTKQKLFGIGIAIAVSFLVYITVLQLLA